MDDQSRPKKSPEALDETKPERNERSWWDWLRGRKEVEESEEEKLRKKLDEELKESARKRATDFEEERRVEEEREVAETKKLKKRWRRKLVEKSHKLLDDAAEQGEEPKNGYEIAKLMVAERIVKLHGMLDDESLDLRRSEEKALKIQVDFMGLLSEKLDRPEIEVPEEVENLYQTIAASVEETNGKIDPSPAEEHEKETPPVSPEDAAYNNFAATIVKAIRRALKDTRGPSGSGGSSLSDTMLPGPTKESGPGTAEPAQPNVAESILDAVKAVATTAETIRQEISHTETSRHLAEVVEKAEINNYASTKRPGLKAAEYGSAIQTANETEPNPEQLVDSGKRIKDMTELELITLAKQVEVEHGWSLSDIYKKGEIDREGLIKVLESYHRGWDYRREFKLNRERWHRHRQESYEYLRPQPLPATDPASAPSSTSTSQKQAPDGPESQNNHEKPEVNRDTSHKTGVRSLAKRAVGKLRDIGLSKPVLPAPTEPADKESVSKHAQARLRRQTQVLVLFTTMTLVILLLLAVIELGIG